MATSKFLAALPVIALLMCGTAYAEEKQIPPHEEHGIARGEPYGADPDGEKHKALREEMRKKFEAMTPEERKAFREKMIERHKEMQAKLDAMTPEEREAFRKKFEETRAAFMKEHPNMGGEHGEPPHEPPHHDDQKEKGQPPIGGQPLHSDKQ